MAGAHMRLSERMKSGGGALGGGGFMTTNNARCAFLLSYHLPAILLHYPRLVRAMQGIAMLNRVEAAACIRDLKAGRRWGTEAVNRYGGTHKVAADAWKYRKAISLQVATAA